MWPNSKCEQQHYNMIPRGDFHFRHTHPLSSTLCSLWNIARIRVHNHSVRDLKCHEIYFLEIFHLCEKLKYLKKNCSLYLKWIWGEEVSRWTKVSNHLIAVRLVSGAYSATGELYHGNRHRIICMFLVLQSC